MDLSGIFDAELTLIAGCHGHLVHRRRLRGVSGSVRAWGSRCMVVEAIHPGGSGGPVLRSGVGIRLGLDVSMYRRTAFGLGLTLSRAIPDTGSSTLS